MVDAAGAVRLADSDYGELRNDAAAFFKGFYARLPTKTYAPQDESHLLSDQFLLDLGGFLNFAFDSRDLLTLWLIGQTSLRRTLQMQQHLALAMRVSAHVHFEPLSDRDAFVAAIAACLATVGGKRKLLADPALDLLFRSSRGVFRVAGKLLRSALRLAHEHDQAFIDEHLMEQAVEQIFVLAPPGAPAKS
jgi:type II secretory pathway predicted ATPase ExeA